MSPIAGLSATTPTETTTPSGSKLESSSEPTPLQNEGDSTDPSLDFKQKVKRANVIQKGARLLITGRLRVVKVDGDVVVAECRGDSGGVYHLGHDPDKAPHWRCTCEARTACSHLHALWAVTAVER